MLTQHYNAKTDQEDRERQVTIYLKKSQSETELLLDLAHELVHAGTRPSFDPYDPTLSLGKYIFAAIEGKGGEVDAVMSECKIGLEISKIQGVSVPRCQNYWPIPGSSSLGIINRDIVRQDFYRVGKWFAEVSTALGGEMSLFPLLSEESPKLYSSTGHAPYPFALMQKFEEITETACRNSKVRMRSLASEGPTTSFSSLFSVPSEPRPEQRDRQKDQKNRSSVHQFLLQRCTHF